MRRLTLRRGFGIVLLLLIIGAVVGWLARRPLADGAVRQALASRGVRASYTIKDVGLRWQRIENLRIGDPAAPDLTADWAEVRIAAGWGLFAATEIRAGGIRLRGRIVGGRLSLGEIDKLLPKPDGKMPFILPDITVDIADARMRIESARGQFGVRIDGKGNLANGFTGKVAAIAPSLRVAGCAANQTTTYIDVAVRNGAPTIDGPIRADSANCAGVFVVKPAAAINLALGKALDQWRGTAAIEANGVRNVGLTLASLTGQLSFDGSAANTKISADLAAEAGRIGTTRLAAIDARGVFSTGRSLRGSGRIEVARAMPDANFVAAIDRAARSVAGTPLAPMLEQTATAARGALTGLNVIADVSFADGGATVSDFKAIGPNQLVLRASGGRGLQFGKGAFFADTQISLSGGGLPPIQSTLQRRSDGVTLGVAQLSPFVGGSARVSFDKVRFAANPAGVMRFETVVSLDGPLAGGRVQGLRIPVNATIAANGNAIFNTGCTTIGFRMLSISGLVLDPTDLQLCPLAGNALIRVRDQAVAGGATIDAPRMTGRLGNAPINLNALKARLRLGFNNFAVEGLKVRLGTADLLSSLDVGVLDGRFANSRFSGRFAKTSGTIGNVPLVVTEAAGNWTFRDGALNLLASLTVSDEASPNRFNALVADNAALRLANGRIDATAILRLPDTRTEVTKVAIVHNLGAGTGRATLDVSDLRFDRALQPELLTPLTKGIVAIVSGSVSGQGDIRWSPDGVSSTGRFKTDGLDFAAAFGPVSGLKGEIVFDDLLALSTPPGQTVTIAAINPGTLVTNGVLTYRLLPEQRLAIESGAWPFAGGDLLLDPTVINMGQDAERKLTFRVVGLDAAKFIQQLEFENLAATGTFDGIMPMYFDANGGRIEGGRLVVRRGGGTLAYVGEISNAAMNVYAKLAFDALKSIRYNNLTIALNGPLDGEIVSQIAFDGINEAPLSPPKSLIARQFIGLPFVFNIKVTAPFRSLLNTARTIQDPTALLQRTIPEMRKPPVQSRESEVKP